MGLSRIPSGKGRVKQLCQSLLKQSVGKIELLRVDSVFSVLKLL